MLCVPDSRLAAIFLPDYVSMKWMSPEYLKALYQQELQHNSRVDDNLGALRSALEQAGDADGLLQRLRELGDDCSLAYKNGVFFRLLLLVLPVSVLAVWLIVRLATELQAGWPWALLVLPGGALIWVFGFLRSGGRQRQLLAQAEDEYEQLKYGFRNQTGQQALSHDEVVQDFAHAFRQGNHSNEIPRYASGLLPGPDAQPFTLFNYHYVNERRETYYENGRRKERTVYDHFDRWGIFIAGMPALGFALTSYKNRVFPQRWDTSSIAFNRRHHITGASEVELAKLFQPANVLMFEQFFAGMREFDLQVSDRLPVLYWGTTANLFKRQNGHGQVGTAFQLAEHLEGLRLPHFEQLLARLQPLLEKMVK